eukprot:113422-Rhodomonas_salina.2
MVEHATVLSIRCRPRSVLFSRDNQSNPMRRRKRGGRTHSECQVEHVESAATSECAKRRGRKSGKPQHKCRSGEREGGMEIGRVGEGWRRRRKGGKSRSIHIKG